MRSVAVAPRASFFPTLIAAASRNGSPPYTSKLGRSGGRLHTPGGTETKCGGCRHASQRIGNTRAMAADWRAALPPQRRQRAALPPQRMSPWCPRPQTKPPPCRGGFMSPWCPWCPRPQTKPPPCRGGFTGHVLLQLFQVPLLRDPSMRS